MRLLRGVTTLRWLVLVLAACGGGSPTAPPPSPTPTPALVDVPSVTTAPAPAPDPPPATPTVDTAPAPPVAPEVDYADSKPVLADLCQTVSERGAIGCACCPPFDECKPNGSPTIEGEAAYLPDVVLTGSFSAKGAAEAVLGSHFDCETNLSAYGHAVIARRVGPRWKLVDHFVTSVQYATGYRLPDGRDLPIVLEVVGKTPVYTLSSWDFRHPTGGQPFTRGAILEWTNDAYAGCLGVEPGHTVADVRIVSLTHVDRDGDSKPDLVLDLLKREGPPTEAYQDACTAMINGENVPENDPAARLPSSRSEWVFPFDGTGFRAAAP